MQISTQLTILPLACKWSETGHSQPERQVKSSLPCFFTTSASRRMSPRWSVCRSFLLSAYITPANVLPAARRALQWTAITVMMPDED